MSLVLRFTNRAMITHTPELAEFGSLSIPDLCRRILAGEGSAFEEFYRRFAPRVYGLLTVLTNADTELSRDLLQIVMVRVARKFRPFNDEEALWAWLAAISRNAVTDHKRTELRRHRRESLVEAPGPEGPSPALCIALEAALNELSLEDQAMIRDFYFHQQPQGSIAEAQNSTVKAIQSRLARIRRRLKESLTRKLQDEN